MEIRHQYKTLRSVGHIKAGDIVVLSGRNKTDRCICHLPGEPDKRVLFYKEDLVVTDEERVRLEREQQVG